jgi:hypothetical protein
MRKYGYGGNEGDSSHLSAKLCACAENAQVKGGILVILKTHEVDGLDVRDR